jgi:hypothetical protein
MKRYLLVALLSTLVLLAGCKKDESTNPASDTTYPVTAIIKNPLGQVQGGATLTLKNAPSADPKFTAISDSTGKATIQAPAGSQVLIAKIGSAFLTEMAVNVQANAAGTNAGEIRLTQNTSQARILVVQASAEDLEDVLRVIGFTTFDSTTITALRDSATADSTRLLNYLRQYTLIFTNCHGGSEGGTSYALLSRTYGRYVQGGGKMYGGHYNYYHLQRIWPPSYTVRNSTGNPSTDSLSVIDPTLSLYVGFSLARWNSIDSRKLSGYEKFSDLPTGSKVYGVIYRTSPPVGVIVENYQGSGKYLWTNYHNQDIKDDPVLVKIVQYFLLSL